MIRSATGTAIRPCHSSRLGLLALAYSPRPSYSLAKAVLLMSLSLLALLLCLPPAHAQDPSGGYPGGGTGGGYPGGGYPGGGYPGGGSGSGGYPGGGYPGSYGSWQVTPLASGSDKYDSFDPQGNHHHYEVPWPSSAGGSYGTILIYQGWQASAESKGTVTYQFDYLDPLGDTIAPPFDHTWVKKFGDAGWTFSVTPDPDTESNGFASDGLGDPEIEGKSAGTHYEKKDTGGGSFSVSADLHSSVAATASVGAIGSGYGSEWGFLSVQDVGLPLVSSDIETSTKKGGALNFRARDGSMSVDSVAVYDFSGGVWRGETFLTANNPFDDPLFTWTASGGTPSTYNNSNVLGITAPSLSSITLNMGLCASQDGLPMTTSVSMKASSGTYSDATDTASYTIQWHAPLEAYAPGISEAGKDILGERFGGIYPGGMGIEAASKGGTLNTELVLDGALVGFALAGQEEMVGLIEVCCHICHVTEFALSYADEAADTGTEHGATNGDGTWGVAVADHNVPPDLANDPLGWHNCKMSWRRVAYWETDHHECDQYGHNGWINGDGDCFAKQYSHVSEEPFFDKI